MLVFHEFKIENTVLQLINTKRNMELLKNVPHREFLDLSVVYRNVFRIDKAGSESVLIDNSMLKSMGITEEMLYSLAFDNTRRKFSAITLPISKIFCWGYSCSTEDELWIMSNEYLWYGGTALLYEDLLHNLAGQLQDNLYILPSSVNEILVLAAKNNKDSKLFREIVSDVMIVL